jgi:predicted nucleic acid-binding protein
MDSVVIDTDVLSYLFKQDSRAESYQSHLDGKFGVISFMTLAELEVWANLRNWGPHRRAQLAAFLAPYAVINSSRELAQTWAAIRSQVMQTGHHIDTAGYRAFSRYPASYSQPRSFRTREWSHYDF